MATTQTVSIRELVGTLDNWVRTIQPEEVAEWNSEIEALWRTSHDLLSKATTQRDRGQEVLAILDECAEAYFRTLTSDLAEKRMRREVTESIEWLKILFG